MTDNIIHFSKSLDRSAIAALCLDNSIGVAKRRSPSKLFCVVIEMALITVDVLPAK
jgi:hypothetical protein